MSFAAFTGTTGNRGLRGGVSPSASAQSGPYFLATDAGSRSHLRHSGLEQRTDWTGTGKASSGSVIGQLPSSPATALHHHGAVRGLQEHHSLIPREAVLGEPLAQLRERVPTVAMPPAGVARDRGDRVQKRLLRGDHLLDSRRTVTRSPLLRWKLSASPGARSVISP